MRNTSEVAHYVGQVAALSRAVKNGERPASDLAAAREALDKARVQARITAAIGEIGELAGALTDAQRVQLADLLTAP